MNAFNLLIPMASMIYQKVFHVNLNQRKQKKIKPKMNNISNSNHGLIFLMRFS